MRVKKEEAKTSSGKWKLKDLILGYQFHASMSRWMYSLTALFWDSKTHDIHAKEWMEEDNGKVDLQAFGIEEGAVEKAVSLHWLPDFITKAFLKTPQVNGSDVV